MLESSNGCCLKRKYLEGSGLGPGTKPETMTWRSFLSLKAAGMRDCESCKIYSEHWGETLKTILASGENSRVHPAQPLSCVFEVSGWVAWRFSFLSTNFQVSFYAVTFTQREISSLCIHAHMHTNLPALMASVPFWSHTQKSILLPTSFKTGLLS